MSRNSSQHHTLTGMVLGFLLFKLKIRFFCSKYALGFQESKSRVWCSDRHVRILVDKWLQLWLRNSLWFIHFFVGV
ncbi:MAG: hypothetical protein KME60_01025 [Cyanomargarita calcarea GSE-NOS-MK-12-04C]|uniref:Uncharacterized protein n=1 Tax=Cyanomargarita calcarea GSE-NOS-MK-12-04C TaxID=2839659 RepID=A0A951UQ73_9CYAN|nr:hypothetical protein [Cyanomargarita calcarea GSE-NOS-MK-12-04C]